MGSNMEDQVRTTTKSILDVVSGNVLDIPNGKDKILDRFKKNQKRLVNNPNQ